MSGHRPRPNTPWLVQDHILWSYFVPVPRAYVLSHGGRSVSLTGLQSDRFLEVSTNLKLSWLVQHKDFKLLSLLYGLIIHVHKELISLSIHLVHKQYAAAFDQSINSLGTMLFLRISFSSLCELNIFCYGTLSSDLHTAYYIFISFLWPDFVKFLYQIRNHVVAPTT